MNNVLKNFIEVADAITNQEAELLKYKQDAAFHRRVLVQLILTNGTLKCDPSKYEEALVRSKDLEFGNAKVCLICGKGSIFLK